MENSGLGARVRSALIWALTTALFAVAFALQDVLTAEAPTAAGFFGTAILGVCHALGGAIAGFLLAGLFGRNGAAGWIMALVGGVAVVLLGGLFGGAFAAIYGTVTGTADLTVDLIRIGLGAVTAPLAIAEGPALALLWILSAIVAHLTCAKARA
ncbi:MAG: hypothetical protein AAGK37_08480 [Pseudomonadota bacterium]